MYQLIENEIFRKSILFDYNNTKYPIVNDDNWTYGVINQVDASDCDGTFTQETKDSIKLDAPMPFVITTTHTAADAYERVLAYAGASLSRDNQVVMIMRLHTDLSTSIESVTTGAAVNGDGRVYTLDGRLVNGDIRSLGKGIYILNNKKIVVK